MNHRSLNLDLDGSRCGCGGMRFFEGNLAFQEKLEGGSDLGDGGELPNLLASLAEGCPPPPQIPGPSASQLPGASLMSTLAACDISRTANPITIAAATRRPKAQSTTLDCSSMIGRPACTRPFRLRIRRHSADTGIGRVPVLRLIAPISKAVRHCVYIVR